MGCCNSSSKYSSVLLDSKILDCMSTATPKRLTYFISLKSQSQPTFNINSTLFQYTPQLQSNLLGLSLLFSRLDLFKYLINTHKATIEEMEKIFREFSTSGMEIVFKNNDIKFFEYYAPIYLEIREKLKKTKGSMGNETLAFETIECKRTFGSGVEQNFNFVQHACVKGHILIIKAALDFCEKTGKIIEEFDVHYIEKSEGFNCAQLACKAGNYSMIKFLHSQAKANFNHLNFFGENCVQVLAAQGRSVYIPGFFQCLVYLIEIIGVNIQYHYEESLILLSSADSREYFIEKLKESGIEIDKDHIESIILTSAQVKKPEECLRSAAGNISEMLAELKQGDISSILVSDKSESSSLASSLTHNP